MSRVDEDLDGALLIKTDDAISRRRHFDASNSGTQQLLQARLDRLTIIFAANESSRAASASPRRLSHQTPSAADVDAALAVCRDYLHTRVDEEARAESELRVEDDLVFASDDPHASPKHLDAQVDDVPVPGITQLM